MDEIIGFDEQIGKLPLRSVFNKARNARPAPARPAQIRKQTMFSPSRPATARPAQIRKQTMFSPSRPAPAPSRPAQLRKQTMFSPSRPAPAASRPTPAASRSINMLKRVARMQKNVPSQVIVKPSGKIQPVRLKRTSNPAVIKNLNPIQKSFMPVDLPYKTLSSEVQFIEPSVDAGVKNYYGK